MRRLFTTIAWIAGYVLAAKLVLDLSRHDWLMVDWEDPVRWVERSGVEPALAAGAWLIAAALVAWVGVSTVVYAVARIGGLDPGRLDWLSIGPVRRVVDTMVAGSMILGTVAPAAALEADVAQPPAGVLTAVDSGFVPVSAVSDPVTRRDKKSSPAPESGDSTVQARPGDHLWKLSEQRLREHLERTPTDTEVAPYWRQVVEINRPTLRSGDPDLIYPGEEVILPAPADALNRES